VNLYRLDECSSHLWECRLNLTTYWNCQHPPRSNLVNLGKRPDGTPKHDFQDIPATQIRIRRRCHTRRSLHLLPAELRWYLEADGSLCASAHRPACRRFEIRVPPDYHRAGPS
jgi:hypothetical protein